MKLDAPARESLLDALHEVMDPEIPVLSIRDLGIVHDLQVAPGGLVNVVILPTFSGCPALDVIARQIKDRLAREPGVRRVDVRFAFDPPWTTDRISVEGNEKLRSFGIAPAPLSRGRPLAMVLRQAAMCPYCGSSRTTQENLFGPTRCRSIYRCLDCRNPFERFKPI